MLFPRSAAGAYELGRAALAAGAPEAAAAALRRARELSPEFDGPAAALAAGYEFAHPNLDGALAAIVRPGR